jgi:hypothetical protein
VRARIADKFKEEPDVEVIKFAQKAHSLSAVVRRLDEFAQVGPQQCFETLNLIHSRGDPAPARRRPGRPGAAEWNKLV